MLTEEEFQSVIEKTLMIPGVKNRTVLRAVEKASLEKAIPDLLYEAWDYGQFSPDFNQPLPLTVRKAIGDMLAANPRAKKEGDRNG